MIKILQIKGKHNLVIKAIADEPPGKDQVRICIKRVSLCGSDYKLFEGLYGAPETYPVIFGHEWSGVVTETGDGVKDLAAGDHVTGDCSLYCGVCENCKHDKNLCENIKKAGITSDGYARSEVVADARYIYKAPESISFKALALAEPFAVAYRAIAGLLNEKKGLSDKNILIIGCGAIGMAAYLLLRYKWQKMKIDVFDVDDRRVEFLGSITGDILNVFKPENCGNNDYASLYSKKKYDMVFEMAGNAGALDKALNAVKPGGKIVTIGIYGKIEADLGLITLKKIKLYGSIGGTGAFEEVIEFLKDFGNVAEKIVTHEYLYTDADKAFMIQDDSGAPAVKRQLIFEE